jgi:hypothetical protein
MDKNVGTNLSNANEIYCRKLRCRQLLGEIQDDGQCFSAGGVKLWCEMVLTCSRCNARFRFIPKPLNDLISLDDLEKHYNF